MSLINDALKRASTQRPATPPPPGGPPLQPVENSSRSTGPLPIILCIVGIGALLMASAFWLKSRGTPPGVPIEQLAHQKLKVGAPDVIAPVESKPVIANNPFEATVTLQKADTRNQAAESNQLASLASALRAPAVVAPTQSAAEPIKTQPATLAATEPAKTQPLSAPSAEPTKLQPDPSPAPTFRLQAIYFRMKGPTVVINGRTLRVGDAVDGAKLVSIERTSAEIEIQGLRQKLTMH